MCNKLLQTYACGHSKSICTTPCVHALRSTQSAHLAVQQDSTITRSNSTVSSLAPATQENSALNFSRPQLSKHSPLSANAPTVPTSPTQVPAFRFVAPDTTSLSPPESPVSPAFTNASYASAPSSRFPSPSPSPTMDEPEPKLLSRSGRA
ncbi:hypothetical protein EJ07DRAFT_152986 [Lizonia empirigonia]|nr:hypothetical protein EJ07DRAFT_152986 [Lizonia empirigonia]